MMILNQPAPDFEAPDLNGRLHHLRDYRGKIVIINFWSCECPHSERTDKALMAMFVQWQDDVALLSVASNRNENIAAATKSARERRLPVVLTDADCALADLFGAQATPHAFVIDREGVLRYRGAIDDVAFRQRKPTRFFLDEAVESLLAGRLPEVSETVIYGCAIVREI